MRSIKVALLASTTLDMLANLSKPIAAANDLEIEWYLAPFNQYAQEILDPSSPSKAFNPNVVLLSVDSDTALNDRLAFLNFIEEAVTAYPHSTIFVHNLVSSRPGALSLLEWNAADSSERAIAEINLALSDLAIKYPTLFVLDLAKVVRTIGLAQITNSKFYYLGKIPFSKQGLSLIAEQLVIAVNANLGVRKKVIVLDLDNTLWGGVIGEDGFDGIKLSNDTEGKAFYDFQKLLYKLWQSGVLLIISSKNDDAIAMEAIRTHPYMVLKESCFAARRINWDNKAGNIKDMAAELNLGLDSFVYFDDSPQERAMVRAALPQVVTPDLPTDPSEYPSFLAGLAYFEALRISDEDRKRGALYQEERQRKDLQKSATSIEEYLDQLEVKMSVRPVAEFDMPRVAQLTQRTNQFNASTKRYTREEIVAFCENPAYRLVTCSASDKYGDYGLLGVAILKKAEGQAVVDTLLMSCRALGRGIEETFIYCLDRIAEELGDNTLRIEYEPTAKNGMINEFLAKIGFAQDGSWQLRSIDPGSNPPKWIDLDFVRE